MPGINFNGWDWGVEPKQNRDHRAGKVGKRVVEDESVAELTHKT